jgi:hypothetical protein
MSKKGFRGVAATTDLDKHGERFSKESLERSVADFQAASEPEWGYWNHQMTLPPILLMTDQKVQERSDGEYELVVEGVIFEEEDFEDLHTSGIIVPEIMDDAVKDLLHSLQALPSEYLKVSYDPRNFEQSKANLVIASINELVPTRQKHITRKAELPEAVVFVLVAFAGGFVARFGELAADKAGEFASSLYSRLNKRFMRLLATSKSDQPGDVVFEVPVPDTSVVVEGAVENVTGEQLEIAWKRLPELYALAIEIIEQNRPDFFSHLKFLLNPLTKRWEVNYLVTRKSQRVILGPRYHDPSHPLRQRWESERSNYDADKLDNVGMSLSVTPIGMSRHGD